MAQRFVLPYQTVIDQSGVPLPGALLYFYISGTNTPLNTYSDNGLTVPNSNPVVADGGGEFPNIFMLPQNYKVVLTDENNVEQWTADPVGPQSPETVSVYPNIAAVRAIGAIAPQIGAIYVEGYTSAGDGGDGNLTWVSTNFPPADNGGSIIRVTGVSTGYYARPTTETPHAKWWGAPLLNDGSTDDTPAIQGALNSFGSAGGTITIRGYRAQVFTNLTVPPGCKLIGDFDQWDGVPQAAGSEFNVPYITSNLTSVVSVATTASIILGGGGSGVEFLGIIRRGLVIPTADSSGFAGTAISGTGGGSGNNLPGLSLRYLQILGFNIGILLTSVDRATLDNISADCLTGIQYHTAGDKPYLHDIHLWPYCTFTATATGAPFQRSGIGFDLRQLPLGSFERLFSFGHLIDYNVFNCDGATLDDCWSNGTASYTGSTGFSLSGTCHGVNLDSCGSYDTDVGLALDAVLATDKVVATGFRAFGQKVTSGSAGVSVHQGILELISARIDQANNGTVCEGSASTLYLDAGTNFTGIVTAHVTTGSSGNTYIQNGATFDSSNTVIQGTVPILASASEVILAPVGYGIYQLTGTTTINNISVAGAGTGAVAGLQITLLSVSGTIVLTEAAGGAGQLSLSTGADTNLTNGAAIEFTAFTSGGSWFQSPNVAGGGGGGGAVSSVTGSGPIAVTPTTGATVVSAASVAGGTILANNTGAAAAWAATNAPVLGVAGTSTGQLGFTGATSGKTTLTVPAVAGTYNFKLPPNGGSNTQVLSTDGTGATSWATVSPGSGSGVPYGTDSGSANAYVLNIVSGPALTDGLILSIQAAHANTGASTLNYNSAGVEPLKGAQGALVGGEILVNADYLIQWNATLTQWSIIGQQSGAVQVTGASHTSQAVNLGQAQSLFLQIASNLSDVASAPTARTNLGLGTAAVQAVAFFLQAANNLSDLGSLSTALTNLGFAATLAPSGTPPTNWGVKIPLPGSHTLLINGGTVNVTGTGAGATATPVYSMTNFMGAFATPAGGTSGGATAIGTLANYNSGTNTITISATGSASGDTWYVAFGYL